MPGHDIVIVLTGCFILAFGWFGFNPGSTLARLRQRRLRIGSIAVNTMLAGMYRFVRRAALYVDALRKTRCLDGRQRPAGGFGGDHGAQRLREHGWRRHHRSGGRRSGLPLSVEFFERVLKVDDPVGAISVHGTNGFWGVISVGLFADGSVNYGGSWNGVNGPVTRIVLRRREPVGRAAHRRGHADRFCVRPLLRSEYRD